MSWLDGLPRSVQDRTLGLLDVWDRGYTGRGVGIAVLDSGVSPHPDLQNRVDAFVDFVNGRPDAYDDMGHGTATAVMAAGNGTASQGWYCGGAPDAHVVSLKVVGPDNMVWARRLVAAIDWAVEHRQQYNIRVLSMSLGMDDRDAASQQAVYAALERACQAGIVPVAAAGNSGPDARSIGALASYPHVVTVAAFDPHDTATHDDDTVWPSSSRGPGLHGEAKPDVLAPGVDVGIATPGGDYTEGSGTSFAAPMVAGIIADWIQANPSLNIDSVQRIIRDTSERLPGVTPSSQEGAGEIRPLAGLQAALAARPS